MKRILVVGSSPNAEEWLAANAVPEDVEVCVINNAWMLVKDRLDCWYTPADFVLSERFPTREEFRKHFGPRRSGKPVNVCMNHFLKAPYWYESPCNGTMLLNVLYDVLNRLCVSGESGRLHVLGCDLVYGGERTHFYGKGTADPLRAGSEWLLEALDGFKSLCGTLNTGIVNISTASSTLLPFEKGMLS